MGRKSSLTDEQWAEIGRRLLTSSESARSLAREFGTSEASVRRKFPSQRNDVKSVAKQIVAADVALKQLPIASQIDALNLVDDLKAISSHLASAGKYGAATAHRLSGIAHAKVSEIDDATPLDPQGIETLKGIAVLTRMANESSEIGLNLLRANKDVGGDDGSVIIQGGLPD
jgi:hypothetical protein